MNVYFLKGNHMKRITAILALLAASAFAVPMQSMAQYSFVTYKQAWNSGVSYGLSDMVTYGGATYLSTGALNQGNTPGGGSLYWTAVNGTVGAVSSLTTTGTGAATLASGVLNIPTPISGSTTCPLQNATNLCITASPYNASGAGLTTTATTGTNAPGTTINVGSCATWDPVIARGTLIAGAGVSGVSYIGPATCLSNVMHLTAATSTSVTSGHIVQHDETAAELAAIAALQTAGGGTIWHPDGTYLVSGPLLDTSGANAVLPMPTIPNYSREASGLGPLLISLQGFEKSPSATIQAFNTTGNFIGGYDATDTGGGHPPFTDVWLDIKGLNFVGPSNPGMVMINAQAIEAFTILDLVSTTAAPSAFPTNAAGTAIIFPALGDQVRISADNVAEGGFFNAFVVGEHARIGSLYAANTANCFTFDGGPGSYGTYHGNTATAQYLWGLGCTNGIVAGSRLTTINVQVADLENTTGTDILDPSDYLHGVVNYNKTFPSYCGASVSGGTNLQINPLQCMPQYGSGGGGGGAPSGMMEDWASQDGSGTTLANTGIDSTNSMTTTNVTWAAATGFTGTVATYNGTTSSAVAASATGTGFDGTTPFSACVWFNTTTYSPSQQFLISTLDTALTTTNPGWRFEIASTGGFLVYFISSTGTSDMLEVATAGSVLPAAGTLTHVCFTYDGSKSAGGTKLYAQGALISSAGIGTLTGSIASVSPAYLGTEMDGTSPFFGALGRVRIFNRVLTPTEVTAMHTAGPSAY
jgi:hypothetical protein